MSDTLADIAARDDTRASLVAVRQLVARTLDSTESAREIASLTVRFITILEALQALDTVAAVTPEAGNPLEDFKARLAAKQAGIKAGTDSGVHAVSQ